MEVRVHPALFGVCNIQEPKTGLEGKFSLRATTAMALLGEDTGNLETFTDAKVTDARVVSLRDRIRVVRAEKLHPRARRSSSKATDEFFKPNRTRASRPPTWLRSASI